MRVSTTSEKNSYVNVQFFFFWLIVQLDNVWSLDHLLNIQIFRSDSLVYWFIKLKKKEEEEDVDEKELYWNQYCIMPHLARRGPEIAAVAHPHSLGFQQRSINIFILKSLINFCFSSFKTFTSMTAKVYVCFCSLFVTDSGQLSSDRFVSHKQSTSLNVLSFLGLYQWCQISSSKGRKGENRGFSSVVYILSMQRGTKKEREGGRERR